jgi:crotonobetainyl-CoA:carnitine CoA-transferase CaiB-like acyl-CoA transferase
LSPEKLLEVNPRLIVCSISGFGRTGPLAERPGYDFAVQALSGLMSITGPVDGPPCKVGVAVTDVQTGLYAAIAILACLHARVRSGHGYAIDMALLDAAVASQVNLAQAFLTSGSVPPRQGNAHLQIVPYQLFATRDGWLVVAIGNDVQWQSFCFINNRDELARDPRFMTNALRVENRHVLVPILEEIMKTRDTAIWADDLLALGIPHAPVQDYAALFSEAQADARGLRLTVRDPQGKPVDLVGSPFHVAGTTMPEPTMPPELDQDTDDVLTKLLGLDAEQIAELRRLEVIERVSGS